MRTLKSVNRFVEGIGCSLFLAAFGSIFVIAGLYSGGFFRDGLKAFLSFGFGPDIFIGFGMMLLWGGLAQAGVFARFGKPEAVVVPDAIQPGEEFEFSYKLPVRRDTEIESIGVFLVLRERIRYYDVDEWTTKDVDRLFQQHLQPGRKYRKQDTIEVRHAFQLPSGKMRLRNAYMNRQDARAEQFWTVKVHIQMSRGEELWGEFGLEVSGRASETVVPQPGRFEVFLNKAPTLKLINITTAMRLLLPHLHAGQIGDLCHAYPSLLLENVTQEEAQQAKDLLESVGAKVTLHPVIVSPTL